MRVRSMIGWAAVGAFMGACAEHPAAEPLAVERNGSTAHSQHRVYEVEQLPSLGGSSSRGNGLTNGGLVAGYSQLDDGLTRRAVLWRHGVPVELGTLGGVGSRSSVPWDGVNAEGMVVGISEGVEPDPLGQRWSCDLGFFFDGPSDVVCHAFVWEDGVMTELPTFGGANAFATGINNRGQAVGWAETAEADPTCNPEVRVRGFKAALWEPRRNLVRPLPPYPGDSASAATAINERGQVVGISGDCDQAVGRYSARRAVMWDHGAVLDIGNLGGDSWHTPMAINSRGDVVGFSNVPGGAPGVFNARAFLWTREGGIRDLGVLTHNTVSQAHGINADGLVVGTSFGGAGGQRAFLWDGEMVDLNTLAPDYPGILIDARSISDRGEITGTAIDAATGARVAFVARPVDSP